MTTRCGIEELLHAEAVARGARAGGAVEREQLRLERRHAVAAHGAGVPAGEHHLLARRLVQERRGGPGRRTRAAPSRRIRRGAGPRPASRGSDRPPLRWCACASGRASAAPRSRAAGRRCARARSPGPQDPAAPPRARPCDPRSSGASSAAARALGQLQHLIDHLAHGLRGEIDAVIGAARDAGAREEQAQVVVDLGDRADGRARVVRGRLLLDGDGRRQAFDAVDVRLVHHREELPRIRRQRLDVAPLALRHTACRTRARTCPSRTGP